MTPEYTQNISQAVIDIYTEIETDLLLNISKKMKFDKLTVDNAQSWQVERLAQLNAITQENIKVIAKQSEKTVKQVNDTLEQSLQHVMKLDNTTYAEAVAKGLLTEVDESFIVKKALAIGTNSTITTFNDMNATMLKSASQEYVKAVNTISGKVIAGTLDINNAIKQTITNLANNGVTGFIAKNGTRWSTEAYSSMVIKSNVVNVANAAQDDRILQSGGDYIEINSYSGARPLCALDQGKIFSLSDNTTPIKDINGRTITPRAWSSSSHGKPAGIFGINCGHSKFLFVPEISGFEREKINSKENSDLYVESQQQRYLERQIRNAKREKAMLESSNADTELINQAQRKISQKQKNIREFITATDRTRRPTREFVGV